MPQEEGKEEVESGEVETFVDDLVLNKIKPHLVMAALIMVLIASKMNLTTLEVGENSKAFTHLSIFKQKSLFLSSNLGGFIVVLSLIKLLPPMKIVVASAVLNMLVFTLCGSFDMLSSDVV